MTIGVQLQPVDTLFLRDGTPFSADGSPQEDVRSLFPPYPPTMAGALRAALARSNGWTGLGRWPKWLNAVLGNGPNNLGALMFGGPIILRRGEPLFPIPRHLLGTVGERGWRPVACIRPGPAAMCDLGPAIRLPLLPPEAKCEMLKAAPDGWLTKVGLVAALRDKCLGEDEIVPSRTLWGEEERVGLEIDRSTRTSRDGLLFSTRHVRIARGVSLGMWIDGVPDEGWVLPNGRLVPLGGESRVAECRPWDTSEMRIDAPLREIEASQRLAIIALTPLDLDQAITCGRQKLEVGGGLRVVSACLDRPRRIGGWDSLRRRPLPLRSVLPAGSTLFCEAAEPRRLVRTVNEGAGLLRLGRRTEWGFGVATVGKWPAQTEVKQ